MRDVRRVVGPDKLLVTPGVRSAEVSYDRGEATVEYDPNATTLDKLRKAIDETGYTCELPK